MGDDHHPGSLTYSTNCGKESTANRESTPPKNVGARRQLHDKGLAVSTMTPPGSDSASRVTSCASLTLELYEILAQVLAGTGHALFCWRFPLPHLSRASITSFSFCFSFSLYFFFSISLSLCISMSSSFCNDDYERLRRLQRW